MKKGIRSLTAFAGKSNHTVIPEFDKLKKHIIVEMIGYVPGTAVNRPILKKTTGNIVVISFDSSEELPEESSSFRYLYTDNKWRG